MAAFKAFKTSVSRRIAIVPAVQVQPSQAEKTILSQIDTSNLQVYTNLIRGIIPRAALPQSHQEVAYNIVTASLAAALGVIKSHDDSFYHKYILSYFHNPLGMINIENYTPSLPEWAQALKTLLANLRINIPKDTDTNLNANEKIFISQIRQVTALGTVSDMPTFLDLNWVTGVITYVITLVGDLSLTSDLELTIFSLLACVAKTGNPSTGFIQKKQTSLSPKLNSCFLDHEISLTFYQDLWVPIKSSMDQAHVSIESILEFLQEYEGVLKDVNIFPLLQQLAWRNLTYLTTIHRAMTEVPLFPWGPIFKDYPVLFNQYKIAVEAYNMILDNPLIGYSHPGFGKDVQHLAYLCTQLLVRSGESQLEQYRGAGSKSNSFIGRTSYDALIDAFTSYSIDLKSKMAIYMKESGSLSIEGVQFRAITDKDDEVDDSGSQRGGFGRPPGDDPGDDDQGLPPPPPSFSKKRPVEEDDDRRLF